MGKPRFVFDTNTFISAILLEGSVNARALDRAFEIGKVVVSDATFSEFTQVLFKKKFDKYLTNERRLQSLSKLERDTTLQKVTTTLTVCRDPKDDKYLELAIDCNAACIVTGDKDLLVLHPFHKIPILTAADFYQPPFNNSEVLSILQID
jgi:putative PIN family toxin of toxin-antitoxin system